MTVRMGGSKYQSDDSVGINNLGGMLVDLQKADAVVKGALASFNDFSRPGNGNDSRILATHSYLRIEGDCYTDNEGVVGDFDATGAHIRVKGHMLKGNRLPASSSNAPAPATTRMASNASTATWTSAGPRVASASVIKAENAPLGSSPQAFPQKVVGKYRQTAANQLAAKSSRGYTGTEDVNGSRRR